MLIIFQGENMDIDHGGQMAGQMPYHGRVTTIGQVLRVNENKLNENDRMVPEHEIETEALNLQSLAQALPTSNQPRTSNQLRNSNRPVVTFTQPQRYSRRRIALRQRVHRFIPNIAPPEDFDTYFTPAVAAFLAGDFPRTALKTFEAFIFARSAYNQEIVADYHREDNEDPQMRDSQAKRRLQENVFRVQTMVTDLERELNRRQMLGAETAEELGYKGDVVRKLREDVIPDITELLFYLSAIRRAHPTPTFASYHGSWLGEGFGVFCDWTAGPGIIILDVRT
ncbi:hypothetical protein RB213_002871 [Colletotrichum asianum]|uniref:Uncharacterized protein n=1 Tax=Colletotrichum asianum TaxID=702518 RepID=A0A8H3ZIR9_9PEZI|nr:hypothetical protein GQ607_015344 [Colletotrichum asianum]